MSTPLPPGQRERDDFPRFGMTSFAGFVPDARQPLTLPVSGAVAAPFTLDATALARLPRAEQVSDFHCVTGWSRRRLSWSGHRFGDVWRTLIAPGASADVQWVVLRGQDGYRAEMRLDDLLAADVLLADRLDGQPLGIEHGAPLRLVAPAHYGYKNVKHLKRLELRASLDGYRPLGPGFLSHERARVALEERGRYFPGWLLRYVYRPLIGPTVAYFERKARGH